MNALKKRVKEFLALPRLFDNPTRRLKREIAELRDTIEITPPEEVIEYKPTKCCGKFTYASHEDAMSDIEPFHNGKKPIRAYKCSEGNWHLTSMTTKQYNTFSGSY